MFVTTNIVSIINDANLRCLSIQSTRDFQASKYVSFEKVIPFITSDASSSKQPRR